MSCVTVLITGCGKHSHELVDCLKNNEDGIPVRVVGTNLGDGDEYLGLVDGVDAHYGLPRIDSPRYIDSLLDVCRREDVDIVLPYITAELPLLARNAKRFASMGFAVSVSSPESLAVLNDKAFMQDRYQKHMPPGFVADTVEQAKRAFAALAATEASVCIKAPSECGGRGFRIMPKRLHADDVDAIAETIDKYGRVVVQQVVSGSDYSVCVLADHGKVERMCGYDCFDMTLGAAMSGRITEREDAYRICENICDEEGLDGNACFDFIVDELGHAVLLECNPRINASIGFVRAAGANMAWLRCKKLLGMPIGQDGGVKVGLNMRKFYDAEYWI